jgi:hypothetical protein
VDRNIKSKTDAQNKKCLNDIKEREEINKNIILLSTGILQN